MMKNILKKSLVLTVVICLLLSFTVTSFAAPETYSQAKNSGTRDEVCTTFDGTSALSYYTGSYSYENLSSLSENQLLTSLRTLMTETHKRITNYDNCRDYADETDCDKGSGNIITLYTSYSTSYSAYNSGSGWNREHVWPKSLGGFGESGAGADLHHIRPSENKTNSNRGNKRYGNVSGGSTSKGNMSGLVGGTYDSNYFEPLDNVKGDVARICLYVYVRWGGTYSKSNSLTNVFKDIDTLLEWCALDPVDTWEMGRNEVVYGIQGNRNVFIDYPELAWLMLGEEVPEDMETPSGMSASGNVGGDENEGGNAGGNTGGNTGSGTTTPPVCTHATTTVIMQANVTCVVNGYTGDVICESCREILSFGTVIYAEGHRYGEEKVTKKPTVKDEGEAVKTCEKCGEEQRSTIDSLGEGKGLFGRFFLRIKLFFARLFGKD